VPNRPGGSLSFSSNFLGKGVKNCGSNGLILKKSFWGGMQGFDKGSFFFMKFHEFQFISWVREMK
jgi:hypothetical protein